MTVLTGLASGCLDGDVARAGIVGPAPAPSPLGFMGMVRCAEGVENEDESFGPAFWFEPN